MPFGDSALPLYASAEALIPRLYMELRRLAHQQMSAELGSQTLSATALVHEVYLRLSNDCDVRWESRRHFYNAAAQAMGRILCDRARRKLTQKRGGNAEHQELGPEIAAPAVDENILAMNESLVRLGAFDPQAAELIQLRYYAGLTWDEMSELTGLSPRELTRQCEYARAWLRADMTSRQ